MVARRHTPYGRAQLRVRIEAEQAFQSQELAEQLQLLSPLPSWSLGPPELATAATEEVLSGTN